MLAIALLLPLVDGPVVPGSILSTESQWAAALACPRVSVKARNETEGTGVVVGVKDGFGYVLTADHVIPLDGVLIRFASRETYPEWDPKRPVREADVVERWPDSDLALLRFTVREGEKIPQLPLAGPGQRPKTYPVPVWTVGLSDVPGVAAPTKAVTVRVDRVGAKQAIHPPGRGLTFYWETDQPPESGRSGGPLLDEKGRVIGLCEAARGSHGYYTHLDEILAALKKGGYGWLVQPKP